MPNRNIKKPAIVATQCRKKWTLSCTPEDDAEES